MTPLGYFASAAIIACLLVALFIQGINVGRRREREDMRTTPNVEPPLSSPSPTATPAHQGGLLTLEEHERRRARLIARDNTRASRVPGKQWPPLDFCLPS